MPRVPPVTSATRAIVRLPFAWRLVASRIMLRLSCPAHRGMRWAKRLCGAASKLAYRGCETEAGGGTTMRLEGKIGIVTAGGSGMGRAGVTRFAKEGAAVAIVDLDGAKAEALAGR